jgi:hypothetical protein
MTSAPVSSASSRHLALASVILGVLAWLPLAAMLVQDSISPPPTGEIQGMAAIGAAFGVIVILGCGALIGTVLAVLALRRPPRLGIAWAGVAINALPLVGILALAAVIALD